MKPPREENHDILPLLLYSMVETLGGSKIRAWIVTRVSVLLNQSWSRPGWLRAVHVKCFLGSTRDRGYELKTPRLPFPNYDLTNRREPGSRGRARWQGSYHGRTYEASPTRNCFLTIKTWSKEKGNCHGRASLQNVKFRDRSSEGQFPPSAEIEVIIIYIFTSSSYSPPCAFLTHFTVAFSISRWDCKTILTFISKMSESWNTHLLVGPSLLLVLEFFPQRTTAL